MGFIFVFVVLPVLVILTIVHLFDALVTKNPRPFKSIGIMWGTVILLGLLVSILPDFHSPIKLTKQKIIGEYRIDTTFYPGNNARWQFNHYKFYITDKDSIVFVTMKNGQQSGETFKYKIKYSSGPPDLWAIVSDKSYHVISDTPTLYRGHKKFYYVFPSKKYGNMFFRKVKK